MTELTPEMRDLLERLAPREPITEGENGYCVHCEWTEGRHSYYYPASRALHTHAPGCAWVQARTLLGDTDLPLHGSTPEQQAMRVLGAKP